MTEKDAIARALDQSVIVPDQPGAVTIPEDLEASLWATLSDWFAARASGDPAVYATWAQSRGYRLTADRPDAHRYPAGMPSELELMWRHYTKETGEFPSDMSGRKAFDVFYARSMEAAGGLMRPVAIAGSGSSEVVFKNIRQSDQNQRPLPLERWTTTERWVNYQTVGDFVHWMPERSYEDVLRGDGSVTSAIVLVAVQGAKGDWLPMTIACYYDPQVDQWHILQATYSNTVNPIVAVER